MYERAVRENLPRVREAIEGAARRVGRGEGEVTLVGITKAHPPDAIRAALAAGLRDVGENRIEELEEKVSILGRDAVTWHMVGHLQSRKARRAVGLCDLLHSVDTLKLARRLSGFAQEEGVRLSALVEVNLSGEEAKAGFDPGEAVEAIHAMLELPGIQVEGLMTMAPFVNDEKVLRGVFSGLRDLHEECKRLPEYRGSELSMGMTNDFELAVEEGSTMVRIGTALFGERPR
jgi:pyridoxal phosphate enzyme (YggS family)